MKKQQDNRRRAIDDLIENVKAQDFVPDEGSPAYVLIDGKKVHMPAYVPYVGPEYFKHHPRILCYAINQNLSKHRSWSDKCEPVESALRLRSLSILLHPSTSTCK